MNASRRKPEADDTPQPAQVPPPQVATGQFDHSFTLQAIMDLQKSFAEVNTNVTALRQGVEALKSKVDDLIAWKNRILGGAIVLGFVGAVLGFLISKASDYIMLRPTPVQATSQAPAPPATTPTPQR